MEFPKKFYSATKERQTDENTVHAPYIRRNFTVDKDVARAEILISGLGFYELYINGKNITKGHMAPYISNPDDIVYFDLYDIRKYLSKGKNTIAIMLGNGFQNSWGGFVWDFDKASFMSAPKFAFKVQISYKDDSVLEFEADETCKCYTSPIYADDIRYGECYDANLEIENWASAEFCDGGWNSVFLADTPHGEFRICEAEPIVPTREISVRKIWREGDAYIYDFGENCAGLTRLKIKGEKNQKITIRHGEMLEDGLFTQRNLLFRSTERYPGHDLSYTQRVIYTCKGDGVEVYQPHFTYFGFQYAKVEGITEEQATPELLTYVVMNSELQERGSFECSCEILNALQKMTRRSTLANFYYFPQDCPHREKNGWTADAALSAEHTLLNLSPEKSYREWLRNIGKAMSEEGSLPGIVPTAGWGFEWGNGPAWDNVLFELPYLTYLYRGDKEILKENAQYFLKYLKYLISKRDEKGLVALGLGDWCPTYPFDGICYKSPLLFTDSVMAYVMCKNAAYMFEEIGMEEEKSFAKAEAERFLNAIRQNLIDFDSMTATGNTQTSQAMAVYYGIFTKEEAESAAKVLAKQVVDAGVSMDLGVLGARAIFHVLTDYGYGDLAYDLCTNENGITYAKWVKHGLNTLSEDFTIRKSLNHHFWGDISAWMIKDISGIRVNPNFRDQKEINIEPHFIEKLEFATGSHSCICGKIESQWQREGRNIILTVTAPSDAHGNIKLEHGYEFEDHSTVMPIKCGVTEYYVQATM